MMTNRTQRNLAPPPMSRLRKMSMKIMITIQIQMKKRKNSSIVQKMSRSG